MKSMMMIGGMLASCALAGMVTAAAQDHHPEADGIGPHGGLVREVGDLKIEVAFDRQGVQVFAVGAEQRPVDLKETQGAVQVALREGNHEPKSIELEATRERGPKHLQGKADLARIGDGQATATVCLTKVPGRDGEVSIEVPFRLARLLEHACPMRCVPPQAEPGKCASCRMDLVAAPFIYACPHHPHVTSRDPRATCPECEMRLEKRAEAQTGGHGAPGRGHGGGGHGGGGHGGGGGHNGGGHNGGGHNGGGHNGGGHNGGGHGPRNQRQEGTDRLGEQVRDFTVSDSTGKAFRVGTLRRTKESSGKIAVLTFWCTTCHSCRGIERDFDKKAREYEERGVLFLMVDSNVTDSAQRVNQFREQNELSFPVLMDSDSEIARYFGARFTTTTAVIDADGRLRYYGGFGGAEAAVRNLMAGEEVAVPESPGGG